MILQSPVTVVNLLVRRSSLWNSLKHLVWVSTYDTPWGWQQNRVSRKVPGFVSGLPSTCYSGAAGTLKLAGQLVQPKWVLQAQQDTGKWLVKIHGDNLWPPHTCAWPPAKTHQHTYHRIHALTEKKVKSTLANTCLLEIPLDCYEQIRMFVFVVSRTVYTS